METNPGEVTQLLKTMSRGAPNNAPKRPDHTLQVTALINEALSPLST